MVLHGGVGGDAHREAALLAVAREEVVLGQVLPERAHACTHGNMRESDAARVDYDEAN